MQNTIEKTANKIAKGFAEREEEFIRTTLKKHSPTAMYLLEVLPFGFIARLLGITIKRKYVSNRMSREISIYQRGTLLSKKLIVNKIICQ